MDKIEITIFKNIFQSICDEMGKILQFSAFSPNIKERKDFSCALFHRGAESFAFGSHIPVHLGAMPLSVQSALREFDLQRGDMLILNEPYRGGTHLPDITLLAPVFFQNEFRFVVANRAHHSDIGGMKAGSMPLASEIFQEGLIIPPMKLVRRGKIDSQIMDFILANVRTPEERRGDILAQIAANNRGINRLTESSKKYGIRDIERYAGKLVDYTERLFRSFIEDLPDGEYRFEDQMDDDGFGTFDLPIHVRIVIKGSDIRIDFSGTSPQVRGGINANLAITYSACLYVLTTLLGEEIPINSGIMRPVELVVPPGSLLKAEKPAAMAGGNVETSQRIVDVLLGAFSGILTDRIPAASQGTMNNISFGGEGFAYYETIGGGAGARPGARGPSGVHTHMTNSLNTPVESIEIDFPVVIEEYRLRRGSGGKGRYRGGDGLIREYRFLQDTQVSILSERRRHPPYGLQGGNPGRRGKNQLVRKKRTLTLGGKENIKAKAGDRLIIKTPGGGGFGETG